MADFPNRIREFRQARGWSQTVLGDMMGTSHANISELERGVTQLTPRYMRQFAQIFGCEQGDLLNTEDNGESLSPDERAWMLRYREADPATRARLVAMADLIAPPAEPQGDFAQARKRA
jgi:transcriptional regulator with XRE-family HTH domain